VPQDESSGKMTGLAEQGALAGTQKKKEGLPLAEERAGDLSTEVLLGCATKTLERQKPTWPLL